MIAPGSKVNKFFVGRWHGEPSQPVLNYRLVERVRLEAALFRKSKMQRYYTPSRPVL
jgi:hypothetical protein